MPGPIKVGRKERMTFAKINEVCEMPNLIQIQTDSYKWFIEEGLREVFEDISPIKDYANNLVLEFVDVEGLLVHYRPFWLASSRNVWMPMA